MSLRQLITQQLLTSLERLLRQALQTLERLHGFVQRHRQSRSEKCIGVPRRAPCPTGHATRGNPLARIVRRQNVKGLFISAVRPFTFPLLLASVLSGLTGRQALAQTQMQEAASLAPAAATATLNVRDLDAKNLFKPFVLNDPGSPFHGLLRRSAAAGLDWYFTSLALAIAPDEALLSQQAHFEAALRLLPVEGVIPIRPAAGLRVVSNSAQLWELVVPHEDALAWNCMTSDFPRGAPLDWMHVDECGRLWRNWGRVAHDAHWSLIDTTDDFEALRQPDSHDSQAAVFLYALARWLKLYGDSEWLHVVVWRLPASTDTPFKTTALTRADIIKRMVRHNLLNHMQDGLFRTFRHNRHPSGIQWEVQYLMDNIECQAALRALIPMFETAGHTAFAEVLIRYERELSDALSKLAGQGSAAPSAYQRWARQSDWPVEPKELAFYPHIAAQYWAGLFDVQDRIELSSRWVQLEPHLGIFSDWWRQPNLHLPAGLPPYLARLKNMPASSADMSPLLQRHVNELTPLNSVISDFVAAWEIRKRLNQ